MKKRFYILLSIILLVCVSFYGCDEGVNSRDDSVEVEFSIVEELKYPRIPFNAYESIFCLVTSKVELESAATIVDRRMPNDPPVYYILDIVNKYDEEYFEKYYLILFSWYNSTPKSSIKVDSITYCKPEITLNIIYYYSSIPTIDVISDWGIDVIQISKDDVTGAMQLNKNKIVQNV